MTTKDESALAFFAEFYWGLRKIIRDSGKFLDETDEETERQEQKEEQRLVRMINKERKRRGIEGKFVPPETQVQEEGCSSMPSPYESEEEEEEGRSDVKKVDEGGCSEGLEDDCDGARELDRLDQEHEGRDGGVEAGDDSQRLPPDSQTSAGPDNVAPFGHSEVDILEHCVALTAALDAQTTVLTTAIAATSTHAHASGYPSYGSPLTALPSTSSSSSSISSEDEDDILPTTSVRRGVYQNPKPKNAKPSISRFAPSRDVARTEDSAAASTSAPLPKHRGYSKKSKPEPLVISESISTPLLPAAAMTKKPRERPPKKSKRDLEETDDVADESDVPPPKSKKKGKGRSKKGIVMSEAEEDPVRVDEGRDGLHLQSPTSNTLSQSGCGPLQKTALSYTPGSALDPTPVRDVSSIMDTETGPDKKSAKLAKGKKSERFKHATGKEWETVLIKNTVGARVDPANILDSGSGKRMGSRKSRTADEVPTVASGMLCFFCVP